MRTFFGILLLVGGTFTGVQAQKVNVTKVPAQVKAAFLKLHSGTKVSWEMENQDYEAGFTVNGKETSEVYSAMGLLLETEIEIKTTELPVSVLAKLKGSKITEAARITKANGTILYEAEVKGKDLLFDSNGNYIKP